MKETGRLRLLLSVGLIIVLATILSLFVLLKIQEGEGAGHPVISASASSNDWGEIPMNEPARSDIVIENTGSGVLTINRVTTSCSCTSATFVPDDTELPLNLKPGEHATIDVTFDPQFHDDQPLGKVIREIYIMSNDPDSEEITIRFEGEVVEANKQNT
ncbi:MAG: DUF1573 domain-containing protein [Candidatus Dojkabacteria bacterium]